MEAICMIGIFHMIGTIPHAGEYLFLRMDVVLQIVGVIHESLLQKLINFLVQGGENVTLALLLAIYIASGKILRQ